MANMSNYFSSSEELFPCCENQHNTSQELNMKLCLESISFHMVLMESETLRCLWNKLEDTKMKAFHLLFVSLVGLYLKTHTQKSLSHGSVHGLLTFLMDHSSMSLEQTIKTAQIKCCKTQTVFEQLKANRLPINHFWKLRLDLPKNTGLFSQQQSLFPGYA